MTDEREGSRTVPVSTIEINRGTSPMAPGQAPLPTLPTPEDLDSSRWWCRRGDLMWRSQRHVARYLYDSGGMWGVWIASYKDGVGLPPARATALWVYGEPNFDTPSATGLPPEEHVDLTTELARMSPLPLSRPEYAIHREILAQIAHGMTSHTWITGPKVRHSLRHVATRDQIDRALAALAPRYVRDDGRFTNDVDHYSLTLAGFDASPLAERVRVILDDALAVIRETFDRDQDMTTCRWDLMKLRGHFSEESMTLATSIFRATRLATGPYVVTPMDAASTCGWQLERLRDREGLFECGGVQDYLDRLRAGTLDGPWPSAPARVIA